MKNTPNSSTKDIENGLSLNSQMGKRIRLIRISKGLSIGELSALSGLSFPALQRIETGNSNPALSSIEAICQALDCKPYELLLLSTADLPAELQAFINDRLQKILL